MNSLMVKKMLQCLLIGASVVFLGCTEENLMVPLDSPQPDQVVSPLKSAKKPAAKLIGQVQTDFTFTPPTFWNGTVDFGDYGTFGITFISLGALRDYSQARPFEEDFVIYQLGSNWDIPEDVVMKGWNAGVVTLANKAPDPTKFHANGKIEEAFESLEMWDGCNFHIKGLVYWTEFGFPERSEGTIRIN
jgi:hypothetical protein